MKERNHYIGFTCGAFELLHAGHLLLFEKAKQYCDYLIVGLQSDPTLDRPEKMQPVQGLFERYTQLKACKFVDEIIPYDTEEDLYNLLLVTDIDMRFLGSEYADKPYFTGKSLGRDNHRYLQNNNMTDVQILSSMDNEKRFDNIYLNRDHDWSTTDLKQKVYKQINSKDKS